jgi:hypothetical protein
MTLDELVDAYRAALVNQETFIWTEGDGRLENTRRGQGGGRRDSSAGAAPLWLRPPRAACPTGSATPPCTLPMRRPRQRLASPTRVARDRTRRACTTYGARRRQPPPPSPSAGEAAARSRAEPKRAAVVKRDTHARDLFASRVSPDELHGAQIEAGAAAMQHAEAAPSLDGEAGKRPGERNENSVLFSLAVLTKSTEHRMTTDSAAALINDDSGLIDLKALAAKTEAMRVPASMGDAALFSPPLGVMGSFGAGAGALSSPLGNAPRSRLPLWVGGGAIVGHPAGRGNRDRHEDRERRQSRRPERHGRIPGCDSDRDDRGTDRIFGAGESQPVRCRLGFGVPEAHAQDNVQRPRPRCRRCGWAGRAHASPAEGHRRKCDGTGRYGRRGRAGRAREEGGERLRLQRRPDVPDEVLDALTDSHARRRRRSPMR